MRKLSIAAGLIAALSASSAMAQASRPVDSCFNNLQDFQKAMDGPSELYWYFDPERTADGWCTILDPVLVSGNVRFNFERLEWIGYGLDRSYKASPAAGQPEVRVRGGDRLTRRKIMRMTDPVVQRLLLQALQ